MSDLLNFSGMLQTTTSSFLRKDNELELAINVHGDNIGSVTRRDGYGALGSAVSAGNRIRGMRSYADLSGGTTRLFAFANGAISYYDGANWQSVKSGLQSDANMEFRVFLDQLFLVGANSSNQYLTSANIDGTTYSTGTNLSGAPNARFIEIFGSQVYMADTQESGTRYPSRLRRSDIPDATGTTLSWTSTSYDDVYTNNGESITGIHTNQALNQLLVFKNSTIHAWDGYRILDKGTIGTDSHRSVVTVNYTTYFFKKGFGIYSYTGSQPQLISRKIEKWIKGIVDPSVVFAGKEDEKFYKLYCGSITVDGVTYTNCEIRYSTVDNTFTVYSYYDSFSYYTEHTISNVTRLYGGTTDGYVHQFALPSDGVYSDNGQPIAWQFMTKAIDLLRPQSKKFIDKVMIYSSNAQEATGRIRVRSEKDWSTHFSINNPEEEVSVNPNQGRFHQFHFSGSSTTQPAQIEGFSFDPVITSQYA